MTLNGRKKNLKREDFIKAAQVLDIQPVVVTRLIDKYIRLQSKFEEVIKSSFLNRDLQDKYIDMLKKRLNRLK